MRKLNLKSGLIILTILGLMFSYCDTNKFSETPIEQFIGIWELKGRSMIEGIKIRIEKDGNEYIGKVVEINSNKYVKLFVEPGDKWVDGIIRSSNFEFRLIEKKVGNALFSLYGQETSTEFKAQFIDQNTIGLSTKTDPIQSKIVYKRVIE